MIRPIDVAWAAGIYEGEGTVGKAVSIQCSYPHIQVSQKDPEILFRLRDMFGGRVCAYKNGQMHMWWLGGYRALGFMFTIFLFLSERRKEQFLNTWNKCDQRQITPDYRSRRERQRDNRLKAKA